MNDKICLICKYQGRLIQGLHPGTIYQDNNPTTLALCYPHSVDLFKNGQINFIRKHQEVFSGYDLFQDANSSQKSSLYSL